MSGRSSDLCMTECVTLDHPRLRIRKVWRESFLEGLFIFVFTLSSFTASAQQGKINIDSYRVLNATPDFADIEIVGSNDGSMGLLCLGAIAKSTDGTVRSEGFPPLVTPNEKQFHIVSRVLRPYGSGKQKSDALVVMVYPCGKDIVLRQQFEWPYVWPEKVAIPGSEAGKDEEPSSGRPWLVFYQYLQEEDFGAIDGLMRKWNNPMERDQNGDWKLDGFRSVFLNYSTESRDWKGDLQRIQKWRAFNPKSAGAAIAEARYWVAYAWHIRGRETGKDADPVALRAFGQRMKRAEKVLKESRQFAADNPLWYEAYLDVAVSSKHDGKFIESLLNEGLRKYPYFQPLYLDMAKYWAPRSGENADWQKVDVLINKAVNLTMDIDGISNYALLYAQLSDLQKFEFDLFQDSPVSWIKMRESFQDLVKRYPSADNLNEFAAFACRAGDKDTFLRIRIQIQGRVVPNKWPGNYSMDLCDHRFMQYS